MAGLFPERDESLMPGWGKTSRDRLRLTLRPRVQPADDALEVGELFDHLRRQIALRKLRGPLRMSIAAQFLH